MKTRLFGTLAAILFAITLPLSASAQASDSDGCSAATLKGDYAFVVSGQIFTAAGTMLRQGVAMTHFDGTGGLTQVDFVINTPPSGISAPVPSPNVDSTTQFHVNENGSYTVNSDCTGSAVIQFPAASGTGAHRSTPYAKPLT